MASNPTQWYRDTRQYLTEVEAEARKITWPAQKEAVAGTIGVMVIVFIIGIILGTADFGLSRLMHWILQ